MNYSPETTGSGPYTAGAAEALADAGAEVHVVTVAPHYPAWRRFYGYSRRPSYEQIRGVQVHRVPVYLPRRPVLASRLLSELSYVLSATIVSFAKRPHVVVGATPGVFCAAIAAAYARLWRVPLVQMVQDIVSAAIYQTGQADRAGLATKVVRWLESKSLAGAEFVTVPTDGFRDKLQGMGVASERVVCIRNWSRIEAVAEPKRERASGEPFVVMHTGNMGMKQGLEELAPTIRFMGEEAPTVRFVFVGDGNQAHALKEATRGMSNVTLMSPVDELDYPATLARADVLLVHQRSTVLDMSLPSKLTSYFAAARPVLAVTASDSVTAAEVARSGAGITVPPGDPLAFLAATKRLQEDSALAASLSTAGLGYARANLTPSAARAALVHVVVQASSRAQPEDRR